MSRFIDFFAASQSGIEDERPDMVAQQTTLASPGLATRTCNMHASVLGLYRKYNTIDGNSTILKWRYCTIYTAIFWRYIPLHRPKN